MDNKMTSINIKGIAHRIIYLSNDDIKKEMSNYNLKVTAGE